MPFSFPNNPSLNQQSSQNGRLYQWDGYVWNLVGNIAGHASTHTSSGTDPITISSSQISNFDSSVSGLLPLSIQGYETLSSNKSTFTVNGGYLSGNLNVFLNGSKLLINDDYTANNGTSFVLTQTAVSGDMVEWQGISTSATYATISHTHLSTAITDFGSAVSGLIPTNIIFHPFLLGGM